MSRYDTLAAGSIPTAGATFLNKNNNLIFYNDKNNDKIFNRA